VGFRSRTHFVIRRKKVKEEDRRWSRVKVTAPFEIPVASSQRIPGFENARARESEVFQT
jgi:hypothetical protein